jgi:hypothetical protein
MRVAADDKKSEKMRVIRTDPFLSVPSVCPFSSEERGGGSNPLLLVMGFRKL